MDAANSPRSTRDALIHELIGNVGQLDDRIKSLPATLNKALEPTKNELHEIQINLLEKLSTLPGAADKELKRAGDAAISSLAGQVGNIANKIAGNAAEKTAAEAKITAAKWQGGMLIAGVLVGVLCTYIGVKGANALSMSAAHDRVTAAELRAETAEADAKKRADNAIAAITEKSGTAIAGVAARNAWASTATGQVAYKLAEAGDLGKIAGCLGEGWKKEKDAASGAVWCYIPQADSERFLPSTKLVPQFRVYDYKK